MTDMDDGVTTAGSGESSTTRYKRVTMLDCPCGVRLSTATRAEIVEAARAHLRSAHPGMDYSEDEILFLAFDTQVRDRPR